MTVISLSVESNLLNRFDQVWEVEGYHNRSEAVRSAMRDFIHTYELPDPMTDKRIERIVVFSFHDSKHIRSKLGTIQHDYQHIIAENLHRHIFEDVCFQMLTLRGLKQQTDEIAGIIRAIRGIESFHTFSVVLGPHDHE